MATVVGIMDLDSWSARTDNIVIIDPTDKLMTWIPRDLWCPSLNDRINGAFAQGGPARLVSALRELGFRCDHALVLRRSATERVAARISVQVPVSEQLDFWYPLDPKRPIEEGRKVVSFRPPAERLEGERIHQWVGARTGLGRQTSDLHRMLRQQIFVRALLEQSFEFENLLLDNSLVQICGDPLLELSSVDRNWRMESFNRHRNATIDGKMVLVKREEHQAPEMEPAQLAVILL